MIDKVILYKKQGSITDEVWPRKPVEIKDAPYGLQKWVGTLKTHIETDNKFSKIELLSIEHRSNGGRTFKAYLYHNKGKYLIDLRDDALLEMIKLDTIKNGIISGSFSFISAGSSLKLVSTKGELYSTFIKSKEKKKKSKAFKAKDLTVGNIYESRRNGKLIYLGEFEVLDCMYTQYETKQYAKKLVFIKFCGLQFSKMGKFEALDGETLVYCSSITAELIDKKIPIIEINKLINNIYSNISGILISKDSTHLDMIRETIGAKNIVYGNGHFHSPDYLITINKILSMYNPPKLC